MISSTSTSGAEAPAVMPSRRMPPKRSSRYRSARRMRRATRAAGALGDFPQALRVGGVGRADHDHRIDERRDALHRLLAVGGGVADVFLVRAGDRRETRLQRLDDLARVVDRERRLGDEGELVRARAASSAATSLDGLDQRDGAWRQLPHRADHLGVAGMADQDDVPAALVVELGLAVHLGDQRAGRVDGEEVAGSAAVGGHGFRHAVGREDHRRVGVGISSSSSTKTAPFRLQALDDVFVVHDLVAHIDRRAVDAPAPARPRRWRARRRRRIRAAAQRRMSRGGFVMPVRCDMGGADVAGDVARRRRVKPAGRCRRRARTVCAVGSALACTVRALVRISRCAPRGLKTHALAPRPAPGTTAHPSSSRPDAWRTPPPMAAFFSPSLIFCAARGGRRAAVPADRAERRHRLPGGRHRDRPVGLRAIADPDTVRAVAETRRRAAAVHRRAGTEASQPLVDAARHLRARPRAVRRDRRS